MASPYVPRPSWLLVIVPSAVIASAVATLDARSGERQPAAKSGALWGVLGGALLCVSFIAGKEMMSGRK